MDASPGRPTSTPPQPAVPDPLPSPDPLGPGGAPPVQASAVAEPEIGPIEDMAVVMDGVSKRFGDDTAVDSISLTVPRAPSSA